MISSADRTELAARVRALEDREAIRELDSRYCRYLDEGQWQRLGECFTEDGVFDGLSRIEGRAAVQEFFAGLADGGLTALWHHVSNYEISVDGDRAIVRSLLWQPCVVSGVAHVSAGRYRDHVVRTEVGWRIREKQVRFLYWSPLADGWDHHAFGFSPARSAATPEDTEP
ncbi:MAG TPA: nuclear transport factor 2 family protein [Blastococcus sp.]|nr:nuclear transport factor 2 family protein [Blastococcus sp.]